MHSSNCRPVQPTSAHPALPTSSAVAGYQPVPAQPSAPCSIARPAKPHARSSCITDAFCSGSLLRQPSAARPRSRPSLQMAFEPPHPSFQALPSAKIFVDLFSGASAPLSAAIGALGLARLEPLDKLHGCHFDLLDDRHFQDLCLLASSGIVGAASAAPPCASFSRARLRPGGPLPVRTARRPTGIPTPTLAQRSELSESSSLHSRARHVLSLVGAHGGLILLENPASSLLWLDPSVRAWLLVHAPSLAGKRNSDGSFATRHTACYPQPLASAIASCMQPFLSLMADPIKLSDWRTFRGPHACQYSQGCPGAHFIPQGVGPGFQPPPSGERALSRIPRGHKHVVCTCQFATAFSITFLPSVVCVRGIRRRMCGCRVCGSGRFCPPSGW